MEGRFTFDEDTSVDEQFDEAEDIITEAVETVLEDDEGTTYDNVETEVQTVSESEITAQVTVTGTNLDSEELVELVETNIIVAIESADESGDTDFIITEASATVTTGDDSDDGGNNNNNNNGVNDYSVFIVILVVFVRVFLLMVIWFGIDNCLKKRKSGKIQQNFLVDEVSPTDPNRQLVDVNSNSGVGTDGRVGLESEPVTGANINTTNYQAETDGALLSENVNKGGVVSGATVELINVELPEQPKVSTPGGPETSDGVVSGEGDDDSGAPGATNEAEPALPFE